MSIRNNIEPTRTPKEPLMRLCRAAFVAAAVCGVGALSAEAQADEEDDFTLPGVDEFLVDLPDLPRRPEPAPDATARLRYLAREANREVQAGNHEAAIRYFRQALEMAPGEKSIRFGLGTSLLAIGHYEEAERRLRELANDFPEDHFILNNLAWLHATSRDIRFRNGERALSLARRALVAAPSAHYVWSTLAEAYYVSGQYQQAARAAQQALRQAREHGAENRQIGEYRRLLEKCRQAARAFEILD